MGLFVWETVAFFSYLQMSAGPKQEWIESEEKGDPVIQK